MCIHVLVVNCLLVCLLRTAKCKCAYKGKQLGQLGSILITIIRSEGRGEGREGERGGEEGEEGWYEYDGILYI